MTISGLAALKPLRILCPVIDFLKALLSQLLFGWLWTGPPLNKTGPFLKKTALVLNFLF
jgi:hypothetical protein